jgi:hypothetical protein
MLVQGTTQREGNAVHRVDGDQRRTASGDKADQAEQSSCLVSTPAVGGAVLFQQLPLAKSRFAPQPRYLMEAALADPALHFAAKPEGRAASKRRGASVKDDLFVCTHAQNFVRAGSAASRQAASSASMTASRHKGAARPSR